MTVAADAVNPLALLAAINAQAIEVKNSTGSPITGPALVYVSGIAADGTPLITKADSDAGDGTYATHVLIADLDDAATGWAFKRTPIRNQNTNGKAVSDPVYLDVTAGAFTFTRPTAVDTIIQIVGRVTVVSATVGEIMIDLSSGGAGGGLPNLNQVKMQVVAGAGANTNIAITGITTADRLVGVARLDRDATAANINLLDDSANCSITSNGNIQSTTNTTGDALLVLWLKT